MSAHRLQLEPTPAPPAYGGRWLLLAVVGVAVLAFVTRLTLMLRGGGLSGSNGYDDSVYLASAFALVHGELPYRDFVLLHPPGMMLALAPFAGLAQLLSDRTGQEIARLAFMALGALNAVLVLRLGMRFGRVAGLAGGGDLRRVLPALWSERTTTLEALGNTTVLVALVLLVDPARRRLGANWRWPAGLLVGAGAALGFGTTVKIWGVVALAVIVVWVGRTAGLRAAAWLVAAAGATIVAVCLPFFLAAPGSMWRMVVVDQLGRPRHASSLESRLTTIVGLTAWRPYVPPWVLQIALLAALAVLAVAVVVAARTVGARVVVVLLLAHLLVLLGSPNGYLHYATLAWAPGAVVLGIAADRVCERLRARGHPTGATVGLVAVLVGLTLYAGPGVLTGKGLRLDVSLATAAARVPGCITADDPTYLIAMNVLSRNYRNGCPVWIDPTGIAIDRGGRTGPEPYAVRSNPRWQDEMLTYLLSGEATMVEREATNLNRQSRAQINELPFIFKKGGFGLRRVR